MVPDQNGAAMITIRVSNPMICEECGKPATHKIVWMAIPLTLPVCREHAERIPKSDRYTVESN